jgi:potassium-transporting ATPase potassium-binding subunit
MSDTTAGPLQVALLLAALAACYRPLGAHMARAYTSDHDTRVERAIYRVVGVDARADQRWPVYARAVLAFSAVSVLGARPRRARPGHRAGSAGAGGGPGR